jgi:hypothetical protein
VFDPRRRHIAPDDDLAAGLCLPEEDLPSVQLPGSATATVTPIAPRLGGVAAIHPEQRGLAVPPAAVHEPGPQAPPVSPAAVSQLSPDPPAERQAAQPDPAGDNGQEEPARGRPVRKAAGGRSRRASVPSWDEIMFGSSRQPD